MTFSGGVTGHLTNINIHRCTLYPPPPDKNGTSYLISAQGSIGNRLYDVGVGAASSNPGTYTITDALVSVSGNGRYSDGTSDEWRAFKTGQLTIAGDGKSGTFDFLVPGFTDGQYPPPSTTIHVTGTIMC